MMKARQGKDDCKSHQISIGFGWVKAAGEKAENHYTIINEKGDEISDYVKIHPFSMAGEEKYFVKGNKLSTCKLQGREIATFICYDLRFPAVFQALEMKPKLWLLLQTG